VMDVAQRVGWSNLDQCVAMLQQYPRVMHLQRHCARLAHQALLCTMKIIERGSGLVGRKNVLHTSDVGTLRQIHRDKKQSLWCYYVRSK